jgi:hypothetical protein
MAVFSLFAASALGLESPAIDLIAQGFLPAGVEFARRARHFDAALTMPEIVQACRNAWTAYGFQPLLDESAHITPSIVGYSLLYPYTDNYLDRRERPLPPSASSVRDSAAACAASIFPFAMHTKHPSGLWLG